MKKANTQIFRENRLVMKGPAKAPSRFMDSIEDVDAILGQGPKAKPNGPDQQAQGLSALESAQKKIREANKSKADSAQLTPQEMSALDQKSLEQLQTEIVPKAAREASNKIMDYIPQIDRLFLTLKRFDEGRASDENVVAHRNALGFLLQTADRMKCRESRDNPRIEASSGRDLSGALNRVKENLLANELDIRPDSNGAISFSQPQIQQILEGKFRDTQTNRKPRGDLNSIWQVSNNFGSLLSTSQRMVSEINDPAYKQQPKKKTA
jgi:hypothetical protein